MHIWIVGRRVGLLWLICATWLSHMCDMTHAYATGLIQRQSVCKYKCWNMHVWLFGRRVVLAWGGGTAFGGGTYDALNHMCDMIHSFVCLDSFNSSTDIQICIFDNLCCWYVWQDSFIYVTWLIHMNALTHSIQVQIFIQMCIFDYLGDGLGRIVGTCDMTHSYVCHDSLVCVRWLLHVKYGYSYMHFGLFGRWVVLLVRVTSLIYLFDMTHSYVCHDLSICVCGNAFISSTDIQTYIPDYLGGRSYCRCVWHDSFKCVTWLTHVCVVTHSIQACIFK